MMGTAGVQEAPRCHLRKSSEPRNFTTGGQQLAWRVYHLERVGDVETDASVFEKRCEYHFKGHEPSGWVLRVLYMQFNTLSPFLYIHVLLIILRSL